MNPCNSITFEARVNQGERIWEGVELMIAMISFWLLIPFGNYILTFSWIISTLSLSTHSSHEVEEMVSASLVTPKAPLGGWLNPVYIDALSKLVRTKPAPLFNFRIYLMGLF